MQILETFDNLYLYFYTNVFAGTVQFFTVKWEFRFYKLKVFKIYNYFMNFNVSVDFKN